MLRYLFPKARRIYVQHRDNVLGRDNHALLKQLPQGIRHVQVLCFTVGPASQTSNCRSNVFDGTAVFFIVISQNTA